ncbi:MAG: thioredoxin [Bacteroidetes bacterium MedPE-SWsnd-G2]|nr:MAG: thioredoxin [Bacteroidetes bacterium MedPE-SWsnd-G2]
MRTIILLLLALCLACVESKEKPEDQTNIATQFNKEEDSKPLNQSNYDLEIYDYAGLSPLINKNDNRIHVVNFWATWCAPCIKELPYFEAVKQEYKDQNVEVLLVSLDFPNKYETALKPFILKHKLQSKVVALNDVDANSWIPKVDSSWSGALPATIIYKGGTRKFYEQSFTLEELKTEINQFLK